MDETSFRKIITLVILSLLIVLSFFIVKPILISIIVGLILVFIFAPVYDWLNKHIKIKMISMILILFFIIAIIFLPLWFLTPLLIKEAFSIYQSAQNIDFITPIKSVFPSLLALEQFSVEIGNILFSFTTKAINSVVNSLGSIILNFPALLLQITVVLFTFFFVLRDKDKLIEYVRTLLPFSKEVEKKLWKSTSGITSSLIYGQFFIGIIQGLVLGIGLFIFRVPNALFLTVLAMIAGVFPVVGTTIISIPVIIYLFVFGNMIPVLGMVVFAIISSSIDNFLRPMIVSRKTKINSGILLVSMIGGLLFFGVLGLLLGPLVISYLLILLELYRKKTTPHLMIKEPSK